MKDPTLILFIATRQIEDVLITIPLIRAARAIRQIAGVSVLIY
jgi:hypothetical protein